MSMSLQSPGAQLSRTSKALLLGAGLTALAAAPAGATEGPVVPPPSWGPQPVIIAPAPGGVAPARGHHRPAIRSARVVPRHVRAGRRARLHLRLSRAGRVTVVITRMSRPHRGRIAALSVAATRRKLVVALPRKVRGHALARGRYRVRIVVTDGQSSRSRAVRRSFVVR